MALNLEVLKGKLKALQTSEGSDRKKYTLNLEPGKTIRVRIVPYKFRKDNPFIELFVHWRLGKYKMLVSPVTFGDRDPFVEFAEKLKESRDKDDYKMAKRIEPKMRVMVPVIVRGKEVEGIKFWSFGTDIYEDLLSHINDPDYGDITDINTGRDIEIETIAPNKQKNEKYNSYNVRVKPNTVPLSDNADLLKKILDEQPEVKELYKPKTFDELKQILKEYLEGGSEENKETTETKSEPEVVVVDTTEDVNKVEKKVVVEEESDLPWEKAAKDFEKQSEPKKVNPKPAEVSSSDNVKKATSKFDSLF